MAPRTFWKGYLKLSLVTCPVAMMPAMSEAEKVRFHTLNRRTGNRVVARYVDSITRKPVDEADEVRGYQRGEHDYVMLEDDELDDVALESTRTIDIEMFVPANEVGWIWYDKPHYLLPDDKVGEEAFAVIREAMRKQQVAALARTVLFRRVRNLLIRAHGPGLVAHTLNFDYEVRPAKEAFAGIPEIRIEGEMLDLAKHIIKTKLGKFDPGKFDDRYEAALAELVRAKLEGKPLPARKPTPAAKPLDLIEALRQSARQQRGGGGRASGATKRAAPKPKKATSADGAGRRKAS